MIFIFDLDGTVIDTAHRYRDLPCGKIDLDYWLANNTPENIMRDSLLPLADAMRQYYAEGHTIVVCTARSGACVPDKAFLARHNLNYHFWLSRGDSQEGDAQLKTRLINDWATSQDLPSDWRKEAIMFDDNVTVISAMIAQELWCIDAKKRNKRLAA